MKRITKKSLSTNLRFRANGDIYKADLEKLKELKIEIKVNEKVRFHGWEGTRRHLTVREYFDLNLLTNFCNFTKGNDGRGGVDSDYIIVTKSEYKKLQKRLAYFI